MLSIVIIGTGNVAEHLFNAFHQSQEVQITQVGGRNKARLAKFSNVTTTDDFTQIVDADAYIIAVSDNAIGDVAQSLSQKTGLVAHTSGTMGMNVIQNENRGVFYPLQTFTQGKPIDFDSIPICIEAQHDSSLKLLYNLASLISKKVYEIDSQKRKKLHLAAVFANNFTNHLYGIGEALCLEAGVSFDLLRPLILETAEKVQTLSPMDAQTGPARRGDTKSMENHLNMLEEKKQIELYTLLSEAIKSTYEEKL